MVNLKVFAIVILLLGLYTLVANAIPQVQSEVPQELSFEGTVTPEQLVSAGEQLFQGRAAARRVMGWARAHPTCSRMRRARAPLASLRQACGGRWTARRTCTIR